MKKITPAFIAFLLSISFVTRAQTWSGSTPGNIYYNSGNVGIGTTSPAQPLDVTGTGGSFSSTAKANALFTQDQTNYRGILLGYDSSGQIGVIGSSSIGANSSLAFWNYNSGGYQESMRLTSAGYLGIGTTSPASLLTLGSTNATNPNTTGSDIPYSSLTFQNTYSGNNYLIGKIAAVQEAGDYVDAGAMVFYTGLGGLYERMRINTNGNLLIGETGTQVNSAYKLDVYGPARANSITVNVTGADFVFAPAYKLKPLSYVATYIDANHHLPGIASAQEMRANGLNLGDNQTKLLQKVEELTLYLIEKDKQVTSQQQQLAAQNAQLQQQQLQIKQLQDAVQKLLNK